MQRILIRTTLRFISAQPHTMRCGRGCDSPRGAITICSMSSSCGFLGGSCGNDRAGGSSESAITGSRVARSVVENANVSFGSVQIYQADSQVRFKVQCKSPHLNNALWADEDQPLTPGSCVHGTLQRGRRCLCWKLRVQERLEEPARIRVEVSS